MKIEFREFVGTHDWGWVQKYLKLVRVWDVCGVMAIDSEKNETVGACLFDNFLHKCAQAHLIITNSMVLRHGFLEECGDYIFNSRGCDRAYVLVSASNVKSLRLVKRLGWKEKTRFEKAYDDDTDYILLEVHKDNFLKRRPKELKAVA